MHHYPNLIYFYEAPLLHDILVRSFQCDVDPCVVPGLALLTLRFADRSRPQFREAGGPYLYAKSFLRPILLRFSSAGSA